MNPHKNCCLHFLNEHQVDFTGKVWVPKESLVNIQRIAQEVFGEHYNYLHLSVKDAEEVWCYTIAGSFYGEGVVGNLEFERWIHQIELETGVGIRYSLNVITPWEK